MPFEHFTIRDRLHSALAKGLRDFLKYIYGGNSVIESYDGEEAIIYVDVPGEMEEEEFRSDVKEWCDEHGCDFDLVDQAPQAPSRQYFSKNMKLMYPRVKSFEKLAEDPRKLAIAKALWKKNWPMPFDETNEDDREDIVLLYNEYMEELSKWKPVIVKLTHKEEPLEEKEGE